MTEVVRPIAYQLIRPDGTLLSQWLVSSNMEIRDARTVTPWFRILSEPVDPPWRLERREPGGEWEHVDDSDAAAALWAQLHPPAAV